MTEPKAIGPKTRLWGSGFAGAFFMGVIVKTTFQGDPANTLHISGQSWAFLGLYGILIALGLSGLTLEIVSRLFK